MVSWLDAVSQGIENKITPCIGHADFQMVQVSRIRLVVYCENIKTLTSTVITKIVVLLKWNSLVHQGWAVETTPGFNQWF